MHQMYRIRSLYVLTHMFVSADLHTWYLVHQIYETRSHMDPHTCEGCSPYIVSCAPNIWSIPSHMDPHDGVCVPYVYMVDKTLLLYSTSKQHSTFNLSLSKWKL